MEIKTDEDFRRAVMGLPPVLSPDEQKEFVEAITGGKPFAPAHVDSAETVQPAPHARTADEQLTEADLSGCEIFLEYALIEDYRLL